MKHLPAFEYRRVRWRNERGWTREITAGHSPDGPLFWRASIAEIDRDGEFSEFAGLERDQVLVSGSGFRLEFPGGDPITVEPPHGRAHYPGSPAPGCRLIDGPAHAFNLFHDPQRVDLQLLHRPLVGPMMVFCQPDQQWLIFLLGGQLVARQGAVAATLEQGDCLWLEGADVAPAANRKTQLDGGGELLMVSLIRRDSEATGR